MHGRTLETQSYSAWDTTESTADPGLQPGASLGNPRSNAHRNSGNKEPTYTRFILPETPSSRPEEDVRYPS